MRCVLNVIKTTTGKMHGTQAFSVKNNTGVVGPRSLRRLGRVLRCRSVCETMKGYKKKALIVWVNYTNLCNSIVGQYFKGTCDVFMSVTIATRKIHKQTLKISVFVNYLKSYVGDLRCLFICWKAPEIL